MLAWQPIHFTEGKSVTGAESFCSGGMVHSLLPVIVLSRCLSDGGHVVLISWAGGFVWAHRKWISDKQEILKSVTVILDAQTPELHDMAAKWAYLFIIIHCHFIYQFIMICCILKYVLSLRVFGCDNVICSFVSSNYSNKKIVLLPTIIIRGFCSCVFFPKWWLKSMHLFIMHLSHL